MSRKRDKLNETNWYEYDWRYKAMDAQFCVDLSYDEKEDQLGNVLISVCCISRKKGLSDSEYRHYEGLRDKLLKKCAMTYVGLIETHSSVYFFFYADDNSVTETIDKYIKRIADRVSYDCRYDNEKEFYKNILIPNTAKLFTEENRRHLQVFEDHGDCMTAVRKVNFHVAFPTEPLRILFEEQARLSGYAIGASEYVPEQELSHGCVIYKMITLNKPDVDDATTRIIKIAEKYDGALSFWDCVLIPKRKSL